jgi:hypothetical protein
MTMMMMIVPFSLLVSVYPATVGFFQSDWVEDVNQRETPPGIVIEDRRIDN